MDLVFVRHLYESHRRMFQTREFLDAMARLVLYRNNGDGTFTDTTAILGNVSGPKDPGYGGQAGNIWGAGFQPGWADLDNDGDLDLYVVNDLGTDIQGNVLWRNDGAEGRGLVDVHRRVPRLRGRRRASSGWGSRSETTIWTACSTSS